MLSGYSKAIKTEVRGQKELELKGGWTADLLDSL